jgi:hypothetical protein
MTPTPDTALAARLAELEGVRFMSVLYEAYRSGQLITLADHNDAVQAAVAKAVEAERDRADSVALECSVWSMPQGVHTTDEWRRGVTDARRDIAAAIRARKGDAM